MDEDLVADPREQRRDHVRVAVVDEAEVADERLVEDGVDRLPVVAAALRLAPDARALTHTARGYARMRKARSTEQPVERSRRARPRSAVRLGQEARVDVVEAEPAELLAPPPVDDLLLGLDHLDWGFDEDVRHVPETGDRPKGIRPGRGRTRPRIGRCIPPFLVIDAEVP